MSNGRLTIWIEGREALPVRAIPYVTGWQMSPYEVAQSMAKIEPPPPFPLLLQDLSAYHLPDDTSVEVLPREWDATIAGLEGYEAELKQQYPADAIGYAVWRKNSAEKLPAGVFVWLNEFARERMASRARQLKANQRRGDDELILAPVLDAETRAMVMQGFCANNAQPAEEENRSEEIDAKESAAEGDAAGVTQKKKGPHSIGVPTKEIIAGFSLDGKDWADLLAHPDGDGKRFKPAMVQPGRRGSGGSALWSPVIFSRLLIEQRELNRGQVIARFKKKWPNLEDEMLAEIGEN